MRQELCNKLNRTQALARFSEECSPRSNISFYKYFTIDHPQQYRDTLYQHFMQFNIFGRVYVATEGINAQISVPDDQLEAFKESCFFCAKNQSKKGNSSRWH
jgi:UPF0176 protein